MSLITGRRPSSDSLSLYTGKLVWRDVLRPGVYNHFMTLSAALHILVSKEIVCHHLDYAANLLWYFAQQGRVLYGAEFLMYNTHTMVHLARDAQECGCLDACSVFPLESYLHQVKNLVHSGRNSLAQVKDLGEQTVKTMHIFVNTQSVVKWWMRPGIGMTIRPDVTSYEL